MTVEQTRVKRKPWVIYVTNNRELGHPIRLLARPTAGEWSTCSPWTMGRRRALKFRTAKEAREHVRTMTKTSGYTYLVSEF